MLYLQSLKLARKNLRAVIKTFYAAMMVEREIAALVILLIPCVLFDSKFVITFVPPTCGTRNEPALI